MNVRRIEHGLEITLYDEAETETLGRAMAGIIPPNTVIGLTGSLGAGKTRLSRAIAEAMGVDPAAIASPTFVLIHEYEGTLPVFHFDVYRLSSQAAFEDLGPTDYWNAGGICLVEWADRAADSLPADAWWLAIAPTDDSGRIVSLKLPPQAVAIVDRLASALSATEDLS